MQVTVGNTGPDCTHGNCPKDDDPEGWYEAAIRCNENRTTNAVFNRTLQTKIPTALVFMHSPVFLHSWTDSRIPVASISRANPATITNNLTAVKQEEGHKKIGHPMACFKCGSTDHLKTNCPHRSDIRYMTMEEREDWNQNLALEADRAEIEERNAEIELGPVEQGFVNHTE